MEGNMWSYCFENLYLSCFIAGSPWGNSSPGVDEERKAVHQKIEKKNNVLPLWGNERTMNLNPMILTNIQSSHYFKGIKIWIYYFCRNLRIGTDN
jgi:hypothetical protein